jgi:hypothetical protein
MKLAWCWARPGAYPHFLHGKDGGFSVQHALFQIARQYEVEHGLTCDAHTWWPVELLPFRLPREDEFSDYCPVYCLDLMVALILRRKDG